MQNTSINFKRQVTIKLADVKLQGALSRLQTRFVEGRAAVIGEINDLQETRTAAAAIRDRVLNDLEYWLLHFEQQATARGAIVHWLSLIHISEPTRLGMISYAVFCLKKKKT